MFYWFRRKKIRRVYAAMPSVRSTDAPDPGYTKHLLIELYKQINTLTSPTDRHDAEAKLYDCEIIIARSMTEMIPGLGEWV